MISMDPLHHADRKAFIGNY